jgi:hypothetical protein
MAETIAHELEALKKRAQAKNSEAEHQKVVHDFEQWAKRHGITLQTHEFPQAAGRAGIPTGPLGGGGGFHQCEPVQKAGNLWCVLTGTRTGSDGKPVCTYKCTVELPGGPGKL